MVTDDIVKGKYQFVRTSRDWNNLGNSAVNAPKLESFKKALSAL